MTQEPAHSGAIGEDDLWTARRASLFCGMPEDTFREVLRGQSVIVAPAGTALFAWGEAAVASFIPLKGLVKLTRLGEGGETAVLAIHGPGRALMLAEALAAKPYSASGETVGPARLLRLDVAALRRRMERDVDLSRALLAAAAFGLREIVSQVEELKAMSGPGRLAAMILRLSQARVGATRVTLPYEKQLIASRLGMTPESFSRAMSRLKAHGVSVERETLTIADVARLRAFATSGR